MTINYNNENPQLDRAAVVSGCQVKSEVHQDNIDIHASTNAPLSVSFVCPIEDTELFLHTALYITTRDSLP